MAGAAYMQERRRHERRAPDLPDGRVRQRQDTCCVCCARSCVPTNPSSSRIATSRATAAPARTRCGSRKMILAARSAGGFALRWSSHGLRYGIGVEMDAWLAGGAAVIVNGSRAHLPQAHARYPALTAVEIRVDPRCWRAGWPDAAGKAKPTSRGGWRAPPGISGTRRVPADTAGQQRGARRRGGGPAGPGPLGPVRRAEGGRHRDHGDPTLSPGTRPLALLPRAAFQQDGGERLFRHQRPASRRRIRLMGGSSQPKSQGTLPSLPCWQTSAAMSSGSTETSVSSAASMSSITSVE